MRLRMYELNVYAEEGNVYLEQRNEPDADVIMLSPEQAELVCAWIMAAASEAAKRD